MKVIDLATTLTMFMHDFFKLGIASKESLRTFSFDFIVQVNGLINILLWKDSLNT